MAQNYSFAYVAVEISRRRPLPRPHVAERNVLETRVIALQQPHTAPTDSCELDSHPHHGEYRLLWYCMSMRLPAVHWQDCRVADEPIRKVRGGHEAVLVHVLPPSIRGGPHRGSESNASRAPLGPII